MAKGLAGRVIHFGFRDPEMRWHAKQKALETSTDDEEQIFQVALDICEELGGFPEETTLVKGRSGAPPRTHPSSWWMGHQKEIALEFKGRA